MFFGYGSTHEMIEVELTEKDDLELQSLREQHRGYIPS